MWLSLVTFAFVFALPSLALLPLDRLLVRLGVLRPALQLTVLSRRLVAALVSPLAVRPLLVRELLLHRVNLFCIICTLFVPNIRYMHIYICTCTCRSSPSRASISS